MNHLRLSTAVLATTLALAAATQAGSAPAAEARASGFTTSAGILDRGAALAAWCPPRLESIRYRPRIRERHSDSGSQSRGFSQLHAGFFDPDGDPPSGVVFGARGGTSIDEHLQLGLGLDWNHRSDRTARVVREVPLPGGGTAQRDSLLARSSTNLFPVMAFLQVSPSADLPFTPYFGVGGGYQVLFLSAEDFRTGESFDATYGGWGWQVWGGAAMPLSGRTRLSAEVFLNQAELERNVDDPAGGASLREVVPMDGVGMRFGLSWGF